MSRRWEFRQKLRPKSNIPKIVHYCLLGWFVCFPFLFSLGGGWGRRGEDLGAEEEPRLSSLSSTLLLQGGLQRTEGNTCWGVPFLLAASHRQSGGHRQRGGCDLGLAASQEGKDRGAGALRAR